MKSIMTSHVKDVQQKNVLQSPPMYCCLDLQQSFLARRKICSATNESKESQEYKEHHSSLEGEMF
jgi:hypothetical protein